MILALFLLVFVGLICFGLRRTLFDTAAGPKVLTKGVNDLNARQRAKPVKSMAEIEATARAPLPWWAKLVFGVLGLLVGLLFLGMIGAAFS